LILIFSIALTLYFSRKYNIENSIVIFTAIIFNPFSLSVFKQFTVHSISRLSALILITFALVNFYKNNLNKANLFASLSLLCKFNFLIDALIIAIFSSIKQRKIKFSHYIPIASVCSIQLFYNYLRFKNPFEVGTKYITNSGPSVPYDFRLDIQYTANGLIQRGYEYFLALPRFSHHHIVPSGSSFSPLFNPTFFTEGFLGLLSSAPIYLLTLNLLSNRFNNIDYNSKVFIRLNLILFTYHFVLLTFFMMSSIRYTVELMLPLFFILIFTLENTDRISPKVKYFLAAYTLILTLLFK